MKWRPDYTCSLCGGVIPNREFDPRGPMTCPSCSKQLQLSGWYLKLETWSGIGLTLILCYLLGFRGLHFLGAFILLAIPVGLIWTFTFLRVIPPRFETYVPKKSKDADSKIDPFPQ